MKETNNQDELVKELKDIKSELSDINDSINDKGSGWVSFWLMVIAITLLFKFGFI